MITIRIDGRQAAQRRTLPAARSVAVGLATLNVRCVEAFDDAGHRVLCYPGARALRGAARYLSLLEA